MQRVLHCYYCLLVQTNSKKDQIEYIPEPEYFRSRSYVFEFQLLFINNHKMSAGFFSLARYTILEIFLLWLDCDSLCHLDSALCNKTYRRCFLDILSDQDSKLFMINHREFLSASFFRWLHLRQLRTSMELRLNARTIQECQNFVDFPTLNCLKSLSIYHYNSDVQFLFNVLDECFALESLSLTDSDCCFDGEVGESVAICCSNLTFVDLSRTNNICQGFMQLFCQSHTSITSFNVSKCVKFNDACLTMICQRWKLFSLDISKDADSSEVIASIKSHCIVNDSTMESMLSQHFLTNLNIGGNRILMPLKDFEQMLINNSLLTALNINYCYGLIDDATLFIIGKCCKSIEILEVRSRPKFDGRTFTGLGVAAVCLGCKLLTSLDLHGFIMQLDIAINMVKSLPSLSRITIGNSPDTLTQCDVCVLFASSVFETIHSLSVTYGFSIFGERLIVPVKVTTAKVVSTTSFAWNTLNGGKSLYPLLPKQDNLHSLRTRCDDTITRLSDYLRSSCRSLVSLDLGFLSSDSFLIDVSVICQKLKTLKINFSDVVDESLVAVCANNPSLETVEFVGLRYATDETLLNGISLLKNLTFLVLSLPKVTSTGIVSALNHNARLRFLHMFCKKVPQGNVNVTKVLKKLIYLEKIKWE
jgi:hypothetical protein